jgi:AraC family transcriptional regulator of adaptative response/methylated-DNA-[protein]-cysteine methyltransferase
MSRDARETAARALQFLLDRGERRPSLAESAEAVGLSEFHFQRLFQREVGVSPKRFLQFLTLRDAKLHLGRQVPLLDASLALGLSGPSRLHDLFVSLEKLTPGEWQRRAAGVAIRWDLAPTPLGLLALAAMDAGLCGAAFVEDEEEALRELRARWPLAQFVRDQNALRPAVATLTARLLGEPGRPLGLVLKGSPLQLKVWEALLSIPYGATTTYAALARGAGAPAAVRAVASAVGDNPIAVLIPCHRVLRATGAFGGYRWGIPRKAALLAVEGARSEDAAPAGIGRVERTRDAGPMSVS